MKNKFNICLLFVSLFCVSAGFFLPSVFLPISIVFICITLFRMLRVREEGHKTVKQATEEENPIVLNQSPESFSSNFQEKYNNLLFQRSSLSENLEKIFHKSNTVNLFALSEFDIIKKEFDMIETLSSDMEEIKKSSGEIGNEITIISDSSLVIKNQIEVSKMKSLLAKEKMDTILMSNSNLKNTLDQFLSSIKVIEDILGVISQISKKTRNLSINASIEASKAGIHGRGFDVLAKEIRGMAENTNRYTSNIHQILTTVRDNSQKVISSMSLNSSNIEEGTGFIQETAVYMQDLAEQIEKINDLIQKIRKNLAQESEGMISIFKYIAELKTISDQTNKLSEKMKVTAEEMSHFAEETVNGVLDSATGESPVANLIKKGALLRQEIETILENGLDTSQITEKQLFEPEYKEIVGGNFPRHESSYGFFFEKNIQNIIQKFKENYPNGEILNIVINDLKKYVPICCKEYSRPLTGDPIQDAKINFTKKFYNLERVEKINKMVSKKDFFLVSYPRPDLNMTLSDLAQPLYIKGNLWGVVRIGFNIDKIH